MSYIEKLAQDDFIWDAILANCPPRKKISSSFDFNICCPMCVALGETRPDMAFRCGLVKNADGFAVSCFNCPLRVVWKYGQTMSNRLKDFMMAIGVSELTVKRMAHRAFSIRKAVEASPMAAEIIGTSFLPTFTARSLPTGAKTLKEWADEGCTDPLFLRAVEYIYSRGNAVAEACDYHWTPNFYVSSKGENDRMNERIIIPFTHKGNIVGFTGRLTAGNPKWKYWSRYEPDYLFNNEVLDKRERKYAFVVEGPLDALAIDGVGTLGAKMSDKQMAWLNMASAQKIVVFDRDKAGLRNIDNALKNDWGVAFPRLASAGWWERDVKDCAEAVRRYGKLYVTRSIIETATFDKRKIEVYRRLSI